MLESHDELIAVKPCLQYGNRKAPKVRTWGLFVCLSVIHICHR